MLSGDNGILTRATEAKEKTERDEIVENAKLDILTKLTEKKGENLTASELEEILISPNYNTQGTLSDEENILERTLTSKDGKYTILVSEIYSGEFESTNQDDIKLIHFTVDITEYTAEEGMQWGEWIESSYNTDGFKAIEEGFGTKITNGHSRDVFYSGDGFFYNGNFVLDGDIIIDGESYILGDALE